MVVVAFKAIVDKPCSQKQLERSLTSRVNFTKAVGKISGKWRLEDTKERRLPLQIMFIYYNKNP